MRTVSSALVTLLSVVIMAANAEQPVEQTAATTLVVAGASGRTGRLVVEQGMQQGFVVRALTRDPERAARIAPDYHWIRADVREPASLAAALEGADYVVCTIGATEADGDNSPQYVDYGGVRNLVDAAVEARVRRFVLISSARAGPHIDHSANPRMGYVLKWKTLGEEYLKASGLEYTIIGPGGLVAGAPSQTGIRLTRREDYRRAMIARADVARVAIASLTLPAARNRSFAIVNDADLAPDQWLDALLALPADPPAR